MISLHHEGQLKTNFELLLLHEIQGLDKRPLILLIVLQHNTLDLVLGSAEH